MWRAATAACRTLMSGSPSLAEHASTATVFPARPTPPWQIIPIASTASANTWPRRSASLQARASCMTALSLSVSGSFANGETLFTLFPTLPPLLLLPMLTIELADPRLARLFCGLVLALLPLSEPVEPLLCASLLLTAIEPRAPAGLLIARFALPLGFGELSTGIRGATGSNALSKIRALIAALLTCHCGSRSIAPTASTSLAPWPTSPNACTAEHRTAGSSSLSHFRQICCAFRSPLGTSC
mmetsp:Transcript_56547/g.132645  ORF Transcript_56547/g.132645 Transcript_56547/m.132645 type:complete len:242 (-) Transcript_56547:698-1423(-)